MLGKATQTASQTRPENREEAINPTQYPPNKETPYAC